MRTGELSKYFGVSPGTIQNWSNEFDKYLSSKVGKQRQYTEDDLLVLATVAKLSADNLPYAEIHKRLQAGERVESASEVNFGMDTRMVPAAAVEQIIDSTGLRVELEQVKAERDKLSDMLGQTQQAMRELQGKYETQMEKLNTQISELQYRLGRAEMEAQIRREMDEKRHDG